MKDDLEISRRYLHEWQTEVYLSLGTYPMVADYQLGEWKRKLDELSANDQLSEMIRDYEQWRSGRASRLLDEPTISATLSADQLAELEKVATASGIGVRDDRQFSDLDCDIPTRFEHPGYYRIMVSLDRLARKSIKEFGVELPDPVLGTLPHAEPHAKLAAVNGSDRPLILFNTGLFAFLHPALTLLSALIGQSEWTVQEAARQEINADSSLAPLMQEEPMARVRAVAGAYFIRLLHAFLIEGDPTRARKWIPARKDGGLHVLHTTVLPAMHFVLLHEYAHLGLGHLEQVQEQDEGEPVSRQTRTDYVNEYAADGAALAILLAYSRKHTTIGYGITGAVAFFWMMILLERARAILIRGTDDPEDGTSLHMLYARLDHLLSEEVRVSTPEEENTATLVVVGLRVAAERLWEGIRPTVVLMHEDGHRPYPYWKGSLLG